MEDINMESLTIRITDKCNLDCSFCSNKLKKFGKPNITKFLEDMSYYCNKYSPSTVTITGGEPMLVPALVLSVVQIAKAYNIPKILLLTNGTLWDHNWTKWANENNISVILGVQNILDGEKTVTQIKNIDALRKINSLSICRVVQWHEEFAETIYLLHLIFGCNVVISFDLRKHHEVTVQGIWSLIKELEKLKSFDPYFYRWFSIKEFFNTECHCDRRYELAFDCSLRTQSDIHNVSSVCSGCAYVAEQMGLDTYNDIKKILEVYNL